MNITRKTLTLAVGLVILTGSGIQGFSATPGGEKNTPASDTTRSIAPYFKEATSKKITPDPEGFIQRWQPPKKRN